MTMCGDTPDLTFERILTDELVRLMMASDGVDEAAMRALLEDARRAVLARGAGARGRRGRPDGAPPWRAGRARAEPAMAMAIW